MVPARSSCQSYHANDGATFVSNPNWWGGKVLPAKLRAHLLPDPAARRSPRCSGGDVDIVNLIVPAGAEGVLNNPTTRCWVSKSSQHRELSMRNDKAPWNNKLVRQAMALSLNRPEIAQALFKGYAQLGNDTPFAPIFRSTNTTVPQRVQDITKAKQLMSQAGHPNGFTTDLYTEDYQEMSDYATRSSSRPARRSASTSTCTSTTRATYYKDHWLSGTMSLVDYGHRGVPNVVLAATLTPTAHGTQPTSRILSTTSSSSSTWRRSTCPRRRRSPARSRRCCSTRRPRSSRTTSTALSVSKKAIAGVVTTGMGQIYLSGAGPVAA